MSLHLKRDDVPERKVMLKTGELKVLPVKHLRQ